MIALGKIGHVHAKQGRYDLALSFFNRSLKLAESTGSKSETASTLHLFGGLHRDRGEPATALDYYQKSLAIREAIGERPGIENLIEISRLALVQGRSTQALEAADRAARLSAETGNRELHWAARLVAGEGQFVLGFRAQVAPGWGTRACRCRSISTATASWTWWSSFKLRPLNPSSGGRLSMTTIRIPSSRWACAFCAAIIPAARAAAIPPLNALRTE